MYVGMGIAIVGEAIAFPRLTNVMVAMLVILWIAVTAFVMFYEEPTLRRMFGDDYIEYCRNVRRWLPRLTPYHPV